MSSSSSSSSAFAGMFEELVDSRPQTTGDAASVELVYRCSGTAEDTVVKAVAEANSPGDYEGLTRQSIGIEPVWVDTNADDGEWRITVRYGKREPTETGDSSYSFDTAGGTQHITQSLQTINSYAPSGETAPDFKGAIGFNGQEVEGADILLAAYHFSETHYMADSAVTTAYKGKLYALTYKTNADAFKGFSEGEVLFLGASGSQRGTDQWEITFRFAASPNKTGLTVGDITSIAKKGWEYLWVRYEEAEDTTAKAIVKRPKAVYVERVYDSGDFSDLGIGT